MKALPMRTDKKIVDLEKKWRRFKLATDQQFRARFRGKKLEKTRQRWVGVNRRSGTAEAPRAETDQDVVVSGVT